MKKFLIGSLAFFPLIAFAAGISPDASGLNAIKTFITDQVIPFLIVIATIVFLIGILRYVTAGGDEEKLKQGRNMMIFGIIALAVMISVWGLVKLLVDTAGVGNEPIPTNIGGETGGGA